MYITFADQDSDSIYTTNQPDIVEHARRCQYEYKTIVNNIPKSKKKYKNTLNEYAKVDCLLASSQRDIGESSNLAQLAQTYDYTFNQDNYKKYICILSVLAQASIDGAKRQSDVNISEEIKRIKKDLNVSENKYPVFWSIIKRDFNKYNLNKELHCPMNYLYELKLDQFGDGRSSVPMNKFMKKHPLEKTRKTCRKVEILIEKYINKQINYNINSDLRCVNTDFNTNENQYLLLQSDYQDLINDISKIYISSNYVGLFSWLLDRAFTQTPQLKANQYKLKSTLKKNKSLLCKVLYDVNKENFLSCFIPEITK